MEEDGHEYQDYEIPLEAKHNLKEIEKQLLANKYTDETTIREHLDLLENLDAEVTNALAAETKIGRNNVTLKHDADRIKHLMAKLGQILSDFS